MRHNQEEKNKDKLFVLRRDSGVHHRRHWGASLRGHQTATHWSLKVELSSTTAPAVSKMVTSTNQPREAAIASGSSTTRLLGTFQVRIGLANSLLNAALEERFDQTLSSIEFHHFLQSNPFHFFTVSGRWACVHCWRWGWGAALYWLGTTRELLFGWWFVWLFGWKVGWSAGWRLV